MGRHKEFEVGKALDAATSVFWRKGYEGTSFVDLTEATGVARPSLYAAFGNKESFFRKVLDHYEANYLNYIREALKAETAREVVSHILKSAAAVQTLGGEELGCLGVNGGLACSDESEHIRQELISRRKAGELALRERLEIAQEQGDLPSNVDCQMLACYLMTFSQGMAVQARGGASRAELNAMIEHVLLFWPSE